MASVRAQLSNILEIHDRDEQLREAIVLVKSLIQNGKTCAIAYNLVGDLLMKQSLRLEDPVKAKTSIREAVVCYERAVNLAPKCVETAAAHGAALVALQLFDLAETELKRGNNIDDADVVHPFIHHIGILRDAGTKQQLITDAKLRIKADLSYISVCRGDGRFAKVLNLIKNSHAQLGTIVDAASKVGIERPHCARARLLYPHVVLDLLRSGRLLSNQLSDNKKEFVMQSALNSILKLASDFPKSLVISLCCAKFNAAVGSYAAAENEYRRAFNILNPDDPRDHDIPLGHTLGLRYTDRVVQAKVEILCGFIAFSNAVENHFTNLSEEQKASFLSVRIDKILENHENAQEMSDIIYGAVGYYRANLSWVSWRCLSSDCQTIVASNPEELLWHICQGHVISGSSGRLFQTVVGKLAPCSYVPNDKSHCGLYLTQDEDGHEVMCVKSLECLSEGILDMLTRSLNATTSSDLALASFVHNLSIPDAEEAKTHAVLDKLKRIVDILTGTKMEINSSNSTFADFVEQLYILDAKDTNDFEVLEELWVKLLEMSVMDKRKDLMDLIAMKRWEELKDMIENQIVETKISGPDMTSENETLLVEETKGPEQKFEASRACRHAYKYGHRALHRRISVVNALSSPTNEDKMAQKEDIFNPYDNKGLHIQYMKDLPHMLSHLILCSACYFERNFNRRCSQILHHFSKLHGASVKCKICSVRFTTADALAYHMNYCHNANPNNQQVIDRPD